MYLIKKWFVHIYNFILLCPISSHHIFNHSSELLQPIGTWKERKMNPNKAIDTKKESKQQKKPKKEILEYSIRWLDCSLFLQWIIHMLNRIQRVWRETFLSYQQQPKQLPPIPMWKNKNRKIYYWKKIKLSIFIFSKMWKIKFSPSTVPNRDDNTLPLSWQ